MKTKNVVKGIKSTKSKIYIYKVYINAAEGLSRRRTKKV